MRPCKVLPCSARAQSEGRGHSCEHTQHEPCLVLLLSALPDACGIRVLLTASSSSESVSAEPALLNPTFSRLM